MKWGRKGCQSKGNKDSPMQECTMQSIQASTYIIPVKIHGFDFPSTTEKSSIIPLCVRLVTVSKVTLNIW